MSTGTVTIPLDRYEWMESTIKAIQSGTYLEFQDGCYNFFKSYTETELIKELHDVNTSALKCLKQSEKRHRDLKNYIAGMTSWQKIKYIFK